MQQQRHPGHSFDEPSRDPSRRADPAWGLGRRRRRCRRRPAGDGSGARPDQPRARYGINEGRITTTSSAGLLTMAMKSAITFISTALSERSRRSRRPGASKSAIVADAVAAWLDRRGSLRARRPVQGAARPHVARARAASSATMRSCSRAWRCSSATSCRPPRRCRGRQRRSRSAASGSRSSSIRSGASSQRPPHPRSGIEPRSRRRERGQPDRLEGRRRAMLRTAMGPAIAAALADPRVLEVMVNPDGALRLDRLGEGRVDTGVRFAPAQVERIIRLVASHARAEVHAGDAPIVSAELPPHGEGGLASGSKACCRRSRSGRASRSASRPTRLYTLTTMCRRHHGAGRATCCRWPSSSGATSSSPAAPARARRRSPTRCSPRWRGSTSASS
jgi:hypothetical protein